MTRVLTLIKGLDAGGAERLLVTAAAFADRERFHYKVAYLDPAEVALRPELESEGLDVTCLDGARGTGWLRRLRALVARERIDVVHAHSPYAAAGARLALPRRLPLVYTEHGARESYRRPTALANTLTYGRNDHVFAVSEHVRASIRRGGDAVETLYQGHDPRAAARADREAMRAELGVDGDEPVIGTVAGYRREKGHEQLLAAAAVVRERAPGTRLVLVGSGPLEDQVRARAGALGLNGTVVFASPRSDAATVAAAFDVFVLPSLYEGLPIALLEAMALGSPVVATDTGGVPEAVGDREQGLLVPPGDSAALAGGILELLEDRALARRLGDAARDRAARFDMRRTVARMEAVYAELTE